MKKQHLNIEKLALNKKVVAQLEQQKVSGGADPHQNFDQTFIHVSCNRFRCQSFITKVLC